MADDQALFRDVWICDFSILQELSRNPAGAVFKAVYKRDGHLYALKRKNVGESMSLTSVQTEVKLLKQLKHENVVTCFGSFWDEDSRALYIILEYCDGGDLRGLINRHKGIGIYLDESFIWRTFDQICAGLMHLHENGIVHRDIKSMNILLADDGTTVKITDLGVSRQVSENTFLLKTLYGTPLYLSPEIVSGQDYNEKTDIWSLGIILYELCALVTPFHGKSLLALAQAIHEGKLDPIPTVYSQEMRDFIVWMLTMDFNSRPSVRQVIQRRSEMKKHELFAKSIRTRPKLPKAPLRQRIRDNALIGAKIPKSVNSDEESLADTVSADDASCNSIDSLEASDRGTAVGNADKSSPQMQSSCRRPAQKCAPACQPSCEPYFCRSDIGGIVRTSLNAQTVGKPLIAAEVKEKDLFIGTASKKSTEITGKSLKNSPNSDPVQKDLVISDEIQISVTRDRLLACIRKHSLLLRRLLKYRTFAGASPDSSLIHHKGECTRTDAEIRRLSEVLALLDRAVGTGTLPRDLACQLELCVREDRTAHGEFNKKSIERIADSGDGFRCIPGPEPVSVVFGKRDAGKLGDVDVKLLDYFQAPRMKKDAFASNKSSHQLFHGENVPRDMSLEKGLLVDSARDAAAKRRPYSAQPRPEMNQKDLVQISSKSEHLSRSRCKKESSNSCCNEQPVSTSGIFNNIFDDRPVETKTRYQRRPHSAIISAAGSPRINGTVQSNTEAPDVLVPTPFQQGSDPGGKIKGASASREKIPLFNPTRPQSSDTPINVYRAQRRQRDGGAHQRGLLFSDDTSPFVMQNYASPILGGNERGDSREYRRRIVLDRANHKADELQKPGEAQQSRVNVPANDVGYRRRNVITG